MRTQKIGSTGLALAVLCVLFIFFSVAGCSGSANGDSSDSQSEGESSGGSENSDASGSQNGSASSENSGSNTSGSESSSNSQSDGASSDNSESSASSAPVVHTVTFDSNGGDTEANPSTKTVTEPATKIDALPAQPVRDGYVFDGWLTEGGQPFTAATTVTASISVYAQWTKVHTVRFMVEGSVYATQTVINGGTASAPNTPVRAWTGSPPSLPTAAGLYRHPLSTTQYTFNGWDNGGTQWDFGDIVPGDMTLNALWSAPSYVRIASVADNDVAAAVAYVNANATEGSYTLKLAEGSLGITVNAGAQTLAANLTIRGGLSGTKKYAVIIQYNGAANSSLFTIGSGASLTLVGNTTLRGIANGSAALVRVNGGTLVMEQGSKITGHTSSSNLGGGGVHVIGGGTFTMNGGTVSGNTAHGGGGGVAIAGGTFTMYGGTVSGNTAPTQGGGVRVSSNSTFTMHGGTVSGNSLSNTTSYTYGGGVFVVSGTFRISNGTVYGNESSVAQSLRNTAPTGAALNVAAATAQYGTGSNWYNIFPSGSGDYARDTTIRVLDGALQ